MASATDYTLQTSLATGDAFLITSATNDDTRRVPKDAVLSALGATASGQVTQYASPLTGTTVTISAANTWLILTPAGTIAALTVALPTATDQQEVLITSSAIVTALTLTGTVSGGPTTLSAGGFARFRYDGVLNTWRRIG